MFFETQDVNILGVSTHKGAKLKKKDLLFFCDMNMYEDLDLNNSWFEM